MLARAASLIRNLTRRHAVERDLEAAEGKVERAETKLAKLS